jgi:hypothetical protein
MTPAIQTHKGRAFDIRYPDAFAFDIEEIAHALSNICRFTGHTREFYSVAQHSVMASYIVPAGDELAALLHDAAEAYIGDVSAPLKSLLPDYRAIERRVETALLEQFGITSMPASVKQADLRMLATERRDLLAISDTPGWECLQGIKPLDQIISPWRPALAREVFLERFHWLVARVAA